MYATVKLYEAGRDRRHARYLGEARCNEEGRFTIYYKKPHHKKAVLYMVADSEKGIYWHKGLRTDKSPVRLATVLGQQPYPENVVIN